MIGKLLTSGPLALNLALWALIPSLTACSGESIGEMDMGVVAQDLGVEQDAGVRALCPAFANPVCSSTADCEYSQNPSPTNCEFCPGYTPDGICTVGQCQAPPRIESAGLYELRISVVGFQTELGSFARIILGGETAGGLYISCQDVYDGNVDLSNPCYNVMDARGSNAAPNMPDVPILTFSGFPSGQHTLFIVYGFAEEGAAGNPIGVSCTEYDVGPPTDMKVTVEGDMMRRIP